jgi:hypothetical protein
MVPESRCSLEGIRQATTEPQRALIERATEALSRDDRILRGRLGGYFEPSLGVTLPL